MSNNHWMKAGRQALLWLAMALPLGVSAQDVSEKPLAAEEWIEVEVLAAIEAIDHETREVTLLTEDDHRVTLVVDEAVQRLPEFAVGDIVRADYLTFLRAEFREPTAEEMENPLVILAEAGRAPEEVDPAGAVGAMVRAVVEIVAIDMEGRRAAIVGPRGNAMIVPVMEDAVLNNISVGELVIMTYAEAVTLSLEKSH